MDVIARIAAGLALCRVPEHRWRRVAVPISSAVALALLMIATSLVLLPRREEARAIQRTAILTSAPSPRDLLVVRSSDEWRGEQFPVVWIEPASDATPVLPPGMPSLPAPGQAVVSPGLHRLIVREPALAARYPNTLVLTSDGIRSADERFAYVRVPRGRTLAGSPGVVRAHAFGHPSFAGTGRFVRLDFPSTVTSTAVLQGVLGFLVLPALLVLVAGAAAASDIRNHRFAILAALGVQRRTLIALSVLETLFLALPGYFAAAILMAAIGPRLDHVPLASHHVVSGDLTLPWWLLLTQIALGVILTALAAAGLGALRSQPHVARPRPSGARARLTPLRLLPLILAIAIIALSQAMHTGPARGTIFITGALLLLTSLSLCFPIVIRLIGSALSEAGPAPALIAGRGLAWNPSGFARPFMALGTLLVIALITHGFIAVARHSRNPAFESSSPAVVRVEWFDPRPTDTILLAGAIGTGLVIPARLDEDGLVLRTPCAGIARYFRGTQCRPDAPLDLPPETAARLAFLAMAPGTPIHLTMGEIAADRGQAIILDHALDLEERVRTAAMRLLPVPAVQGVRMLEKRESPLVLWLLGGLTCAFLVLALACVIGMIDRLLVTRRRRKHLLALGMTARQLAWLELWLFAAPYLGVITVSFAAGMVLCWLIVMPAGDVAVPWRALGLTLAIATGAGLLGAGVTSLIGVGALDHRRIAPA